MKLRDLVVIVPGIGGSVLERDGRPVWGDRLARIAGRVIDPEVLSLAPDDGVRAVGPVRLGLVLPALSSVHGYGKLVNRIVNRFQKVKLDVGHPDHRVPDANLVVFPYDFRKNVAATAQELQVNVERRLTSLGLTGAAGDQRVVVVAHSLGGLVARYWLGPLGGWPRCKALITLGTPHRGTPKALDCLVNGVRLAGVPVPGATAVLRGWPSVYELLPRYQAVLDEESGEALYPSGLGGAEFQWRADDAYRLHREIERAWAGIPAGVGPEVVPVFGEGHRTVERCVWGGGVLRVTDEPADWLGQTDWRGDGSVPSYAAVPLEMDGRRGAWRRLPRRHGALPSWRGVVDLLETYQGESTEPVRGDPTDGVTLGVGVEEWYPAGGEVVVTARLHHSDSGGGTGPAVQVGARLFAGDGETAIGDPVDLRPASDGWEARWAGLAPGVYSVEVSATGVASSEPRPVREVFGVVEPEVVG